MKLRKLFYLLLALPLVFAACESESDDVNKTPEVKEPVLTLTSNAEVDVTAAGGEFEITYTLENKKEGVELTATCEADWVSVTAGDKVKVVIEANEGEAREAKVVVAYEAQKFEVTYKQVEKGEVVPPALTLTSEATLEFTAEGGNGEITYTLENAVEGVELAATCEAAWVTELKAEEKVTFKVAANEGEARETKVVVAYGELNFEVAVKQAAKAVVEPQPVAVTAVAFGGVYTSGAEEEMDVDNWFFTLTDKPFTAEGDVDPAANAYTVDLYLAAYEGEWQKTMTLPVGEYTLDAENTNAAGKFNAETSVYLAPGAEKFAPYEAGKLVVTETGLTLTVTIAGVEHTVTYEGAMTLVNDSEEPTKPVEATVIEVAHAFVTYYGDQYNPGVADNFGVIFSSVAMQSDDDLWKPSTKYYRFDLYTALVDATEDLAIPYGTYKLDMNETYAVGTVDYAYSKYFMIDSYGSDYEEVEFYDDATVTVSESGIVAEFVIDEENFKLVFEGSTVFVDSSPSDSVDEPVSTLTEDVVLNITGATLQFEDFGDYYYNGTNNYVVYIHEDIDGGTGAYIMFDLLTAGNAANIAGEYTLADNEQAYTAFTGYFDTWDEECYGAWYIDMDTSAMAPIVGGKFTVAIADDGTYTFTLDCADDAENAITGTIVGKPEGADEGGNEGGEDGGETGGDEGGNEGGEDGGVVNVNVISCESYGGEGWYELVFHVAMLDGSEGYWGVRFSLSDSNINNNLPDGTYSIVGGSINPEYSNHDEWNDYDGKCTMSSATLEVSGGSAAEKTFTATWTPNNGSNKTYSFTWTGAY